jgi:hypothetical protein
MTSFSKDYATCLPVTADPGPRPTQKPTNFFQNLLTDDLSDIDCHAREWVLPSPDSTMSTQSRRSSAEHEFECRIPSPLIHNISEEDPPDANCSLPCCATRSRSQESIEGGSPSIPIPKRVQHHRRVDSEVMRKLTDSELNLAPDGTVRVEMSM